MKVYLVHGDTYFEGYGYRETVFGIYTVKEEAEIARKSAAKQLYEEKVLKMSFTDPVTLNDVEEQIDITELELNQATNVMLGMYIE